MSEFTLDTLGVVSVPHSADGYGEGNPLWGSYTWDRLSPFTQGYVEAMFAELVTRRLASMFPTETDMKTASKLISFSDLAPETLAAILKDCATFRAPSTLPKYGSWTGAEYWRARQTERWGSDAPAFLRPVTPYLGDDGRVYLREAAR